MFDLQNCRMDVTLITQGTDDAGSWLKLVTEGLALGDFELLLHCGLKLLNQSWKVRVEKDLLCWG